MPRMAPPPLGRESRGAEKPCSAALRPDDRSCAGMTAPAQAGMSGQVYERQSNVLIEPPHEVTGPCLEERCGRVRGRKTEQRWRRTLEYVEQLAYLGLLNV